MSSIDSYLSDSYASETDEDSYESFMAENQESEEVIAAENQHISLLPAKKHGLILFYSSGCPHCQEFLPKFIRFAKEYKKGSGKWYIAETDKHDKLAESLDIQGVPWVATVDKRGKIRRGKIGGQLSASQLSRLASEYIV